MSVHQNKRTTLLLIGVMLVVTAVVVTACAGPPAAAPAAPAAPASSEIENAERAAPTAAPAGTPAATPPSIGMKPIEGTAEAAAPAPVPATEAAKEEAQPAEAPTMTVAEERPTPVEPTSVAEPAAAATEAPAAAAPAEPTQPGQLDLGATPTALPPAPAGAAIEPTATAPPSPTTAPTQAPPTAEPTATPAPTTTPIVVPSPSAAIATAEARIVELEWPPSMRLGDSDLVRLALIPSEESYTVTTEFTGNETVTQSVSVKRPSGFDLSAIARLDGVGFDIGPHAEQRSSLPAHEPVTWRWTISPRETGQHRLALSLRLLWTPQVGNPEAPRESLIFSKGLSVQVNSILGMTISQASAVGLAGLALSGLLGTSVLLVWRSKSRTSPEAMKSARPNASLAIEPQPGIQLSADELQLLRALFRRYARIAIEREFRSGYSGARTLLILPIRSDGGADAYTIAKIGERDAIQREFDNYEAFVRKRLPVYTARIEEAPVTLASAYLPGKADVVRAVLQYTFVGGPGQLPISLREALLANPDPALLYKLFDAVAENWWMQRSPYIFRLAQEYDRMLPAHLVVEPVEPRSVNTRVGSAMALDGNTPPANIRPGIGQFVQLRNFRTVEMRGDGISYSLTGASTHGQPPLRVRYNSAAEPRKDALCRIVFTRETLLWEYVAGMDRFGLPDPLDKLASILNTSVQGTRSTIHGDLNLENALLGPGGLMWLIDFASTREGHPLYDFAHLQADMIARVIAPQTPDPRDYLTKLNEARHPRVHGDSHMDQPHPHSLVSLLMAVSDLARRCLFNPQQPREFDLASYVACLGALKYSNLDHHQRHLLYLTAAHVSQRL